MRFGSILIFGLSLAAGLTVLQSCGDQDAVTDTGETALAIWSGFHKHESDRIPSKLATNPGTPWGPYLGSQACQRCHQDEHRRWRGSFHSRTLYDATPETVFGKFAGQVITAGKDGKKLYTVEPYAYVDPVTDRERYFMKVRLVPPEDGGPRTLAEAETYGAKELPDLMGRDFEVIFAFGNRRHQPYVARQPGGKYWILPVFWNDVEEEWKYSGFRPYVRSCASCHVTGIKTSDTPYYKGQPKMPMVSRPVYNLPPKEEQWADGAVGCENCHGPGRAHVIAVERVGVDRYRALRQNDEKPPTIWDGRTVTDRKHETDVCGSCHNFNTESSCSWMPTPEGFTRDPIRRPLAPDDKNVDWQFYKDGSDMSPCTVVDVFRKTKMYEQGVGCADCHDPHGTENWADLVAPIENNELCLMCHDKQFPTIEAQTEHSKHRADSPGNLCVECHMPRQLAFTNGVHIMSDRIYKHDFSIPTGTRRPGGPAGSCNICHVDRSHKWTRARIKEWWPPK